MTKFLLPPDLAIYKSRRLIFFWCALYSVCNDTGETNVGNPIPLVYIFHLKLQIIFAQRRNNQIVKMVAMQLSLVASANVYAL